MVLSSKEISQILEKDSFQVELDPKKRKKMLETETIKPKVHDQLFDLNKSQTEDIVEYFYYVKDIEKVNQKFDVDLKDIRYGLTIPNKDPQIKGLKTLEEELNPPVPTPTENLYEILELNSDSSYEEYENLIQKRYNFASILGETETEYELGI